MIFKIQVLVVCFDQHLGTTRAKGSDYFKVLTLWPQIKCWSTYPHGSMAAWPQPLKSVKLSGLVKFETKNGNACLRMMEFVILVA